MKYFITINSLSAIGKIYAKGDNDGFVSDGNLSHPLLACTEIETSNPYYILATRPLRTAGGSNQTVYLPHDSVVSIHRYDVDEALPFGFVPS